MQVSQRRIAWRRIFDGIKEREENYENMCSIRLIIQNPKVEKKNSHILNYVMNIWPVTFLKKKKTFGL